MKSTGLLLCLVVALTGVACGDDDDGPMPMMDGGRDMGPPPPPPPPRDMGPREDAGPRDMGMTVDMGRRDMGMMGSPLPTCAMPQMVTGMMGTTTVMVDTTGGAPGPLALGACAVDGMGEAKPQAVIAYVVPGTGSVGLEFTTDTAGTGAEMDTMIEVRTGDCDDDAGSQCFDDIDTMGGNYLSGGAIGAMGGDTVYFVLTGYPEAPGMETDANTGPIQLDITTAMNAAPTMTSATAEQIGMGEDATFRITVMGGDPDGNAVGATFELLNAMGMPAIDVNGDGMTNADDAVPAEFDEPVEGMMTFTGTMTFNAAPLDDGATQIRIATRDQFGATSATMMAPIRMVMEVGFGAMCDGTMTVCAAPLMCTMGTCQASAAATAACMAATSITLDAMNTGTASGTLMPGDGNFSGSCGTTPGTEGIYNVTVPAGMWDLIAATDVMGTDAMADTVVYARRVCADPGSEPMGGCNDDVTLGEDARSHVEAANVMPGTYSIFVEAYGGVDAMMTLPYTLQVRLRPVLGAGAACDPMGVMNRCSTGACPMAGMCPPAT